MYKSSYFAVAQKEAKSTINHFSSQSLILIAPIHYALIISQSRLQHIKPINFFFSNKSKLEDAVHKHTKLSLTVRGLSTQHQSRTSLRYLTEVSTVWMSVSRTRWTNTALRICNESVQLPNTHTPCNRRAGDNGVECHRKLRGRGDVMLGVTGLILQRG